MLLGSCLCGGVKYEISGLLSGALNCLCSMCRKAHSSAFRSRAQMNAQDFKLVQGEELVTWFESSPGTYIAVSVVYVARRLLTEMCRKESFNRKLVVIQ